MKTLTKKEMRNVNGGKRFHCVECSSNSATCAYLSDGYFCSSKAGVSLDCFNPSTGGSYQYLCPAGSAM